MKTIEVAVELLTQMGEWSEPVRVRYTEDPTPMLEFQTVDPVAWLREQGAGEEVQWCEYHRSQRGQGLKNECWRAQKARDVGYDDYEDCKMVSRLMIVGTALPPTGETL